MKSFNYLFNNINSFYILAIIWTIFAVIFNPCVAVNENTALIMVNNSGEEENYDTAVSTFTPYVSLLPHTLGQSTLIIAVNIIIMIIICHYTY